MSKAGQVIIGIVVVVAIGVGVWWVWIRKAPVADGVVFVGDSVTYMSIGDLAEELGSKHPSVLARVGYRSTDLLPLFEKQIREREVKQEKLEQVVLLVGYNDVLRDDVEAPALGKLMDQANRFDCAVWLTLPTVPMRDDLTKRWNERVKEGAKTRKHIHVVDEWRKAVEASAPGELVSNKDGVHPTKAGAARLTKIFHEAIGRSCRFGG